MKSVAGWMGCTAGVAVVLAGAETGFGKTVSWMDWTNATTGNNGSASGVLTGGEAAGVGVTFSGQISFAQTNGGTNYWSPNTPFLSDVVDNAPDNRDIIASTGGSGSGTFTIEFSEAVENPIFAFVSLGQSSIQVTYDFNAPFDILSDGPGYWGGPGTLEKLTGDRLTGVEGHGVIKFSGTFTSISWIVPVYEYWHGFTIGVIGDLGGGNSGGGTPPPGQTVPTPAAAGLGLVSLAGLALRRRRDA